VPGSPRCKACPKRDKIMRQDEHRAGESG
jgi:hypothetical protein